MMLVPEDKLNELHPKGYDSLQKYAKKNCNKCYGRGYTGITRIGNIKHMVICKCVKKNIMGKDSWINIKRSERG